MTRRRPRIFPEDADYITITIRSYLFGLVWHLLIWLINGIVGGFFRDFLSIKHPPLAGIINALSAPTIIFLIYQKKSWRDKISEYIPEYAVAVFFFFAILIFSFLLGFALVCVISTQKWTSLVANIAAVVMGSSLFAGLHFSDPGYCTGFAKCLTAWITLVVASLTVVNIFAASIAQ